AAFPGSGGSYRYLLESYGPRTWGRLFAFLFIWQFLLSGPLELASGLIALDQFSHALSPAWQEFNDAHTLTATLWESQKLSVTLRPGRVVAALIGLGIIVLLYRNLRPLGRITVVLWGGVLALLAWVLVAGWMRFDPARAFDFSGDAASFPNGFATG